MMGIASLNPSYEFSAVIPATAAAYWVPAPVRNCAQGGDDDLLLLPSADYNPSTALVMMLRWISLEPP